MQIDLSDEIVQDFLVEAGEILDGLANQLVDLETHAGDQALLNAIFRGFHTIKGGAGFLAFENLVAVSHKAEDVFDGLRRGELRVDADLMDVVLQSLDVVNDMFAQIRAGRVPGPAPAELLRALAALAARKEDPAAAASPLRAGTEALQSLMQDLAPSAPSIVPVPPGVERAPAAAADGVVPGGADITEEEFEQLLEALHGAARAPVPSSAPGDDEITEAEFDRMLDELHGTGKAPGATAASGGDDISEAEFDRLLDQLHGTGKSPRGAMAAPEADAGTVTEAQAGRLPDHSHAAGKPPVPAPSAAPLSPPEPAPVAPTPRAARTPRADTNATHSVPAADTTVRVETAVLDRIMNMVGELVLIRNRLATLEGEFGDERMTKTVSALAVVSGDLQAAAMQTRMQPIRKVFGRFPRVVRDLARSMGKDVNLELSGEDTDLDKNLVEALADPLVHLVRNSVDHGVELPDVRVAAGKPRAGTVRLSAEQEGDRILLMIRDDGAGMDPAVLRRKAVEKGMLDADAAARLSDRECFELIFAPGFSTKAEISDISGRGVGMDVVKTRITQLNGTIEIDSRPGRGTNICIRLPLTLAIMPTLMVVLGSQIFALPLVNVREIIDCDLRKVSTIDGQRTMVVRGRPVPLCYLSRWLVRDGDDYGAPHGQVVIVSVGLQTVGLLVDNLVGREEVVIKPLGALLHGIRGLAGATITGDGRIALILDLPALVAAYARRA